MTARTACALLCGLVLTASGAPPKAPPFRVAPAPEMNAPGKAAASAEAQKISRQALSAFVKGDLAEARKGFLKVLQLAPDNVPTLINLGLVEHRQKDFDKATARVKKAVRLDPDAGLGWLVLGVIAHDRDRLDEALAALAQATLLEPKNATAHHYLGVTIGKKGWLSGAEDEMRKAIELDPLYAEAHFNLAVFYLQRNPPAVELARRHYQESLDLGAAPDPEVSKRLTEPKE